MTKCNSNCARAEVHLVMVCHEERSRAAQRSRPWGHWTGSHPDLIHNFSPTRVAPSLWERSPALDIVQSRRVPSLQARLLASRVLLAFLFMFRFLSAINTCTPSAESHYEWEQPAKLPDWTRGLSSVPPGTIRTICSHRDHAGSYVYSGSLYTHCSR